MKALLISIFLLSGCASIKGVEITDDERKACEAQGCTVWTQNELGEVAKKFFNQGYRAGKASI